MALESDVASQSRSENNDAGAVTMVIPPTTAFPSRLFGDFAKLHRIGGGHTRASFSPQNGRHLACATWRTKSIDPLTGRFCVLSIWNVQEGVCLRKWGAGAEQWNGTNLVHNFGFYSVLFHPNYNDGNDEEEEEEDDENHENNANTNNNNNNNDHGVEKENDNENDKDNGRDNNDTSSSHSSSGSNRHCQYLVTQYCDKRNTAQVWELTKKVRMMPASIHHSNNGNNGHSNYYYEDYTVPHKDLISTSGGRCRNLQPLRVNLPPAIFVKQGVGDRRIMAERPSTTSTTLNRRNSDTDTTTTSTTVGSIPDATIDENKTGTSSSPSSTLSPWLLALGGTQKIGLWSIPEGIQERQASHDVYRIMAMAVSPDGNVLATSNAVGDANLWSTRDGRLLRALSEPSCNLHAMKFTDNGRTLVCVGMTGTLQLCDASF
jgi:hypothetical protein